MSELTRSASIQILVIVIGLVCLVAAVWAARALKDNPKDWDYRDDL